MNEIRQLKPVSSTMEGSYTHHYTTNAVTSTTGNTKALDLEMAI